MNTMQALGVAFVLMAAWRLARFEHYKAKHLAEIREMFAPRDDDPDTAAAFCWLLIWILLAVGAWLTTFR